MKRRTSSFNPKRAISVATPSQRLKEFLARVGYGGNPEHKRNPGDFGLDPPSSPRLGKALCDGVHIESRAEALALLRKGIEKGLVSEQVRFEWPQNVWSVTSKGEPLEAQLERPGIYHGYPMPKNDPFRQVVLDRWMRR